jgi:DNA-binding beta-propeller fold protein YncE
VDVVNLDAGELAGKIPDTNGVHGIAIAPELKRGFVSAGRDNQVVIFNLEDLSVIGKTKTGENPDGILYDPHSKRVFTFNGRSKDLTAIDAKTGRVEGTLALGGKPEFPATDGKGNVYVNIEDTSELVRFDPRDLKIKNRWPLAPCESPSGLAIDTEKHRLFSVCENEIMAVVDAESGRVVATVPTGAGTDAAAFDPQTKLAFASNGGSGTLSVIQQKTADEYLTVADVKTQRGARTMALDTKTHKVYLSDADFGPAPAPTPQNAHPRPQILPGSFKLLVVSQ